MTHRSRWAACVLTALACVAAGLVDGTPAVAAPGPSPVAKAGPTQVGSLTLRRCDVMPRALCGSVLRPWDPAHPGQGRVRVGFAYVPARDRTQPAVGTLVPHEGGPGYSTTGTGAWYARMYGPLLQRRNLLLVDQRGTGRSQAINCPALQDLKIAYNVAARRCALLLGPRADDYTTARSADDLSEVISRLGLGAVDLYGDSYGTFFTQVFTGRHPTQVRSLVLDSAYPTYGESAFYPTQAPAMRHAFDVACTRSAACRAGGRSFHSALLLVLQKVRHKPWRGVSHDADGRRARVSVNGRTLVTVAFGATYSVAFYREMTAALRSGLRGDREPLLRLVAEAIGGGTDAGDPVDYSEGLDAAVACHDYPQLYDMRVRPGVRERQYAAALARAAGSNPALYGPFTVREYAGSDWQSLDWCTRWPIAPADNPAGPPTPPGGYPSVPVLVLSGEMDSITTPAEGRSITEQFPNAEQVLVRNSFHVTAVSDIDNCAQRLVRSFVLTRGLLDPALRRCADTIEPVRSLGVFPRALSSVHPGTTGPRSTLRARRTGRVAALTVADVVDRWWNNYSGVGNGLRGGRFSYTGDKVVRFRLNRVKLVPGVAVTGVARWDRYGNKMRVQLTLRGAGPHGRLHGGWHTRNLGADALLVGRLDGRRVSLRFPAP
ncbi:MAG: alpha/beta fold hydrolase [Marmoricola sp.]